MPNRILKESICSSDSIDQLSQLAEITFYRLIVNCDDYGRLDARPKMLKAKLFPLKEYSEESIISWIRELEKAKLITLYRVDGKYYLQMNTWEEHQQVRNHKSKYPAPDSNNCNQLQSIDINCNQLISDDINSNHVISEDINCTRNPIQSESISESVSLSESKAIIEDDDAHLIQSEQNKVLNAAEDAGMKMSNDVRASLISLYAEHGLQKMLDGLKSCSEHGAATLAYLRAVLRGTPKKQKSKVEAQNFPQRDYSDVDSNMMDSLAREIAEMNAREVC